jgi:hypothetical protein
MVQMQQLAATTKHARELAPKSPAHQLKVAFTKPDNGVSIENL